MNYILGFIGCGNMGGALARAAAKAVGGENIAVNDYCEEKAQTLASETGAAVLPSAELVKACKFVVLGVKPQTMEQTLAPLSDVLKAQKNVVVTMAAGVSIAAIRRFIGAELPVIRIMPNTPTSVGKGVIPYCANDLVTEEMITDWLEDMSECGLLDPLEERLMDAASALSGSGPAYLYLMLEAMADGGVACGLPRAKAMDYAAMTMAGSAEMVLATKQHPGALKDAVCSPGGSTIVGVRALEQHGFRGAAMDCVIETYKRNKELGK